MANALQPRRIQRAHEEGFLNARCTRHREILRAYGLWCWRMAIPMVWYERRSPSSRLSRVHLDMMTTPCRLTMAGHAALIALSAAYVPADRASIGPHGAVWDGVPPEKAAQFARSVFRTARRAANSQFLPAPAASMAPGRQENVVPFPSRAVSA